MITILFVILWAVIPTALEGIQSFAVGLAWVSSLPLAWMIRIKIDRVLLSIREGRRA